MTEGVGEAVTLAEVEGDTGEGDTLPVTEGDTGEAVTLAVTEVEAVKLGVKDSEAATLGVRDGETTEAEALGDETGEAAVPRALGDGSKEALARGETTEGDGEVAFPLTGAGEALPEGAGEVELPVAFPAGAGEAETEGAVVAVLSVAFPAGAGEAETEGAVDTTPVAEGVIAVQLLEGELEGVTIRDAAPLLGVALIVIEAVALSACGGVGCGDEEAEVELLSGCDAAKGMARIHISNTKIGILPGAQ